MNLESIAMLLFGALVGLGLGFGLGWWWFHDTWQNGVGTPEASRASLDQQAQAARSLMKRETEHLQTIENGIQEVAFRLEQMGSLYHRLDRIEKGVDAMRNDLRTSSASARVASEATGLPVPTPRENRWSVLEQRPNTLGNRPPNTSASPTPDPGEAAKEFLHLADARDVGRSEVMNFFAARGLSATFIESEGDYWSVLAIHPERDRSRAVGIPAIRVGMGRANLRPYFDLVNYNGFDHIRRTQIHRFAELNNSTGEWLATTKGVIDGSL